MSTKEKIYNLIELANADELELVCQILEKFASIDMNDVEDDKFCNALYNEYLNDADPTKEESITLEELAGELGIDLE